MITGKASFYCSKCGTKYSLKQEDFDFQAESCSERGMGEETQYAFEYQRQCDSCDQDIEIKFEVWEYPVGIVNDIVVESHAGASNVKSEITFDHAEDKEPDDENNRLIGAVAGGAILGGSLGGPFGALVGAFVGGVLGDSVNKSKKDGGENG